MRCVTGQFWLVSLVVVSVAAAPALGQATFVVANDAAGVHYRHQLNGNPRTSRTFGTGAAAADYDNDGDIDLFVPQAFGFPNELYRNNGDGTFSEVAAQIGLASLRESRAAIWVDYDNDGWLDLFVGNDPNAPALSNQSDPNTGGCLLYRNLGDGTFADVTAAAGFGPLPVAQTNQTIGGLAAGDINNDGWLDLYVSSWFTHNALYINNGDGTFSEASETAGVHEPGASWQPVFYDVDRDGWMDLLLNMDFSANHLFINQHDSTFVEANLASGFATAFNEMGMALGDYDNDGDLDVLCTNIETPYDDPNTLDKWTVLLRNDTTGGAPAFTERARDAGVARTGWGWGCTWFDCDNDGWLDLAVTNGYTFIDPSRFFLNLGNGQFAEQSTASGFDDILPGRGLIAFDYDDDGRPDLFETNRDADAHLFHNETPGAGHWLAIDLLAAGPGNVFAVGAEITVTAGGRTQTHLVTAGVSFLSAEPYRQLFGLGSATSADQVSIRWPDASTAVLTGVTGDRRVRIRQGVGLIATGDTDADGDVDAADLASLTSYVRGPDNGMAPGSVGADADQDGDVDLQDVAAFARQFGG